MGKTKEKENVEIFFEKLDVAAAYNLVKADDEMKQKESH